MNRIPLLWQLLYWLLQKLGLDKPKKADPELIEFLTKKGFHFEQEAPE